MYYDAVIIGGGPAGASIAARLAQAGRSVAVFEMEEFPREHIGESFASPVVPCLYETGALSDVLSSPWWIQKFGGYYSWDQRSPSVSFFRHRLWEADGINRWSMHVNRAEFDAVLLRHAARCGAHVTTGIEVRQWKRTAAGSAISLSDGRVISCRWVVNASGRSNASMLAGHRGWLSGYKNIAIWAHFTGGQPAQSLAGDWNIFRDRNLSPIGCFAFENGWCWYIPIPQLVNDKIVPTHSIGIVTDPLLLKTTKLTQPDVFMRTLQQIPLLRFLIKDVKPIYDELRVATNYSMISPQMADAAQGWVTVGDASFFVDPLFSSGVSFAMMQAASAFQLVNYALNRSADDSTVEELCIDYDDYWHVAAEAFALNIDQWYAAIAHENPNSVYWHERASNIAFKNRHVSFDWLLDTDLGGDLFHVMTRGTRRFDRLARDGALVQAVERVATSDPPLDAIARLLPGARLDKSMRIPTDPGFDPRPNVWLSEAFWEDPLVHGAEVAPLFGTPQPCIRIRSGETVSVKADNKGSPSLVFDVLKESSATFGQLRQNLSSEAWRLLMRLWLAGIATAHKEVASA